MIIIDAELYMAFTTLKNYKNFLLSINSKESVNKIKRFKDCGNKWGTIHLVKRLKDFEKAYGKVKGKNPKTYDDALDLLGYRG